MKNNLIHVFVLLLAHNIYATFIMHNKEAIYIPREYLSYSKFVNERLNSYNPVYNLPTRKTMFFDPIELITWWRFDIVVKYIYALQYEHNIKSSWAPELYRELLRVWGGFSEWDNSRNSLQEYFDTFHNVIRSIKKNGFDLQTSKIRIDNRKFPCEGAHRIGASLLYNKKIACYYDPDSHKNSACQATAIFFEEFNKYVTGGLSKKYLDAMALQYCELKKNTLMVLIASSNFNSVNELKSTLRTCGNIVYHKTCTLTQNGLQNLQAIVPLHFEKDIQSYHINAFLFELHNQNNANILYEQFNTLFKNTDQKIYISINHLQSIELAQTFFVQNSIDFINRIQLLPHNTLNQAFIDLQKWIKKNKIDSSFLCVDAHSAGFLANKHAPQKINILYHGIPPKSESSLLSFENISENDEIIFNPCNHFYYRGIKCASSKL